MRGWTPQNQEEGNWVVARLQLDAVLSVFPCPRGEAWCVFVAGLFLWWDFASWERWHWGRFGSAFLARPHSGHVPLGLHGELVSRLPLIWKFRAVASTSHRVEICPRSVRDLCWVRLQVLPLVCLLGTLWFLAIHSFLVSCATPRARTVLRGKPAMQLGFNQIPLFYRRLQGDGLPDFSSPLHRLSPVLKALADTPWPQEENCQQPQLTLLVPSAAFILLCLCDSLHCFSEYDLVICLYFFF